MGTVSLLDCDHVDPGKWGLAQLFLEEPVDGVWGQPFVLRDSSAEHTLGGGQVLQPVATKVRRRHLEVLERIEQLWTGDAARAGAGGRLVRAASTGSTPADLVRGAGLGPDEAEPLVDSSSRRGKLARADARPQPHGCCSTPT